jgi:hypothetical protein
MVANRITRKMFRLPPAAWYAAGVTTNSDGTGITVLSNNIRNRIVP